MTLMHSNKTGSKWHGAICIDFKCIGIGRKPSKNLRTRESVSKNTIRQFQLTVKQYADTIKQPGSVIAFSSYHPALTISSSSPICSWVSFSYLTRAPSGFSRGWDSDIDPRPGQYTLNMPCFLLCCCAHSLYLDLG